MAEVREEFLAPNTEVVDVENGKVIRQRDDNGLTIITFQWFTRTILIWHHGAIGAGLGTSTHPEVGVWKYREFLILCIINLLNKVS